MIWSEKGAKKLYTNTEQWTWWTSSSEQSEKERKRERVCECESGQFRRCIVAILVYIEFEWLSNEHMRNVKRYAYFVRWLRRQRRRPWWRQRQRTENEWRWFPCRPQRIFSTSNGFSRQKNTQRHTPSAIWMLCSSLFHFYIFFFLTLIHSHIRIHTYIISTINRYIHCTNQIKGALCVCEL